MKPVPRDQIVDSADREVVESILGDTPGSSGLRIALYHPWIYLKGGIERTILEIFQRSRHDWTIFTGRYEAEGTFPEFAGIPVVELERLSAERRYGAVLRAAASIARTRMDADRFDVLVICCDGLGDLMTVRNYDRPVLCLCFTPLRAAFDDVYRSHLLAGLGMFRPLAMMLEAGFKIIDRICWRRYDAVIAISQTVRHRISAGRLWPMEAVKVLHPGIDLRRIAPSPRSEPFFLIAGRIMWTKNVQLGLEAFERASTQLGDSFRLVIAGMVDRKSQSYFNWLREKAGADPRIEFVIDPTDAELQDLYASCTALVFTVFNEDWGLVPLEAMSAGKPVIAVARGGPCEIVVHGETGFLEPDDPEAFARRMVQIATDAELARDLGCAGSDRVRQFGWDAFVGGLDDAVELLALSKPAACRRIERRAERSRPDQPYVHDSIL